MIYSYFEFCIKKCCIFPLKKLFYVILCQLKIYMYICCVNKMLWASLRNNIEARYENQQRIILIVLDKSK